MTFQAEPRASSGIAPPPANGSWNAGRVSGSNPGLPWFRRRSRANFRESLPGPIEDRFVIHVFPNDQVADDLEEFVAFLFRVLFGQPRFPALPPGSLTSCAKERPGRRQAGGVPPKVEGRRVPVPDRFLARGPALISSSGNATSISFGGS